MATGYRQGGGGLFDKLEESYGVREKNWREVLRIPCKVLKFYPSFQRQPFKALALVNLYLSSLLGSFFYFSIAKASPLFSLFIVLPFLIERVDKERGDALRVAPAAPSSEAREDYQFGATWNRMQTKP